LLVEIRSQVNFDGRPVIARDVGYWIGIHGIDMVVGEIHHNDLRVTSFSSRHSVSPNILRRYFAMFWKKVALEAGFVIVVGFPNHAGCLGMSLPELPVGVIIDVELSM